jgi:uncharacterized protein (TIGR02597 family)
VTATSATITWTTDESATSQVEFGPTVAYGSSFPVPADPALVTAHSVILTGLSSGQLYNYRVKSMDAAGNSVNSGNFTFTTTGGSGSLGPFMAGADTYINGHTSDQGTNYGSQSQLVVSGGAVGAGYPCKIYLRFNVAGLPAGATVTDARVQLYTLSNGASQDTGGSIYRFVPQTPDWNELQPIWTLPLQGARDANPLDTLAAVLINSPYEFDGLQSAIAGNGWVTFVIESTFEDGARYYSINQDPLDSVAMSRRPKLVLSYTTGGGTDTTPPVITGVTHSNVTATSATITWTTDDLSDSQVEYGPNTSYGQFWPASPDPVLRQAHSVTLSGLAAGARYNYTVRSTNAAGLPASSPNQAFETLELAAQPGVAEKVVGFNRIVVPASSDVLLTVPFNRRREGAFTVATVTGTGVSVADTLTPGIFAGRYYVRFTSGAGEGLWSTISGNGTNTFDLSNEDVLPFVQPGDSFNVYRHHTLGSLFPSSLFGVSFTNGTQIFLYENDIDAMMTNPASTKIAAYAGSGAGQWTGAGVDNGTVLLPETRFVLRNNAAQQFVVYTHGGVPDYQVKLLIAPAGDLVVGTGYPVPVVLNGSGLEGSQRQVLLYDNGASGQNKSPSKTATYNGSQWTGTGVTGNEPLNASESFTLRLPAGEAGDVVTVTKPYD